MFAFNGNCVHSINTAQFEMIEASIRNCGDDQLQDIRSSLFILCDMKIANCKRPLALSPNKSDAYPIILMSWNQVEYYIPIFQDIDAKMQYVISFTDKDEKSVVLISYSQVEKILDIFCSEQNYRLELNRTKKMKNKVIPIPFDILKTAVDNPSSPEAKMVNEITHCKSI